MADGDLGEATALAMSVMVKLGEAFDAEKMVPIASAHIDGAIYRYEGEVSLLFAERLAAAGAKVRVPTTLSMGSRDINRWREFRMPAEFAEGCRRMEEAYYRMGEIYHEKMDSLARAQEAFSRVGSEAANSEFASIALQKSNSIRRLMELQKSAGKDESLEQVPEKKFLALFVPG